MRWLLIPVLAVIGALLARSFLLDALDELAVRGAWAARGLFDFTWDNLRAVMKTDAGKKIAGGFVAGGLVGLGAALALGGRRRSRR